MAVSLVRCALVWLGLTLVASAVALATLTMLAPPPAAPPFVALMQVAAALALLACTAWAWGVATVVVAGAARTHLGHPGAGRTIGPAWARRVLLTACGVALVGLACVPAHAAAPRAPAADAAADRAADGAGGGGIRAVVGLPLPDRTTGPLLRAGRGERGEALDPVGAVSRAAHVISRRTTHTVRPGDSLWSIAEDLLDRPATTIEVADLVHHLYATNRAVIGGDPDLILPGHQLRTPLEKRPTR